MKNKSKIFGMFAVAALATIGFSACSDDNVAEEAVASANGESDKVEVSINLGGEIATSTGTMTRADDASNDLYNILIEDANTGYAYACGIFDGNNLGSITVSLDRDATYNIKVGMIRDAKNVIYHKEVTRSINGEETSVIEYGMPYNIDESYFNKFSYIWDDNFYYNSPAGDMELMSDPSPEDHYGFAFVDRYFGRYNNYAPVENGTFTIEMLRMSFQLVINVENLGDGETLTLTKPDPDINFYPDIVITSDKPYNGDIEGEGVICTLPWNFYEEEFSNNSSYESFLLIWKDANGEEKKLKPGLQIFGLQFYRAKKYTVNITLSEFIDADNTASITIVPDQDITESSTYLVNKDGVTETTESNGN